MLFTVLMDKSLCKNILALDNSIRFVALSNNLGTIEAAEYRTGLKPLMTIEETNQYAIQAVTRAALRDNFTSKLGRFEYSIGKYSKLLRAVIPIEKGEEETFLLLSFDVNSDVVGIIENKIMRFLDDNIRNK
ncbi:MAG: hypothetical protein WBP88_13580 [Nitrososphaeraceae archaeon]